MAWTVHPAGEWSVAVSDNPAADMPAALALPQTWQWKDSKKECAYVHKSQVGALLTPPGPPVAGYMAWYDASQITGQADNTPLSTWPDLSANHYDLVQTGAPTYYKTTAAKLINGKPAVWFTAAPWSSMMTAATLPAPPMVFIVAGVASLSDIEGLVESQNGGYSLRVNSGKLDLLKQGNTDMASSTGSVTVAPFMVAVTYDGAHVAFYINSATADSTVAASAVQNAARLAIASNDALNGPIAEMILYPSVLTGPQIASTYTYLKAKWGTP